MVKSSLTPEQIEEIRAAYVNGETLRDLGDRYYLDYTSIYYYVKDIKVNHANPVLKVPPYTVKCILNLHKRGYMGSEIARRYNISRYTVYNYLRKYAS